MRIRKKIRNKQSNIESSIDDVFEKEIEFVCPVRGKIKQIVKIKKIKAVKQNPLAIANTSLEFEDMNSEDDLSMYEEVEE